MTLQPDSYITLTPTGQVSSYVGSDAVALATALALKHALQGYAKFRLLPTRRVTPTGLLRLATALTGKPYRRGQHATAAADVATWCEATKAAIPVITQQVYPT